MKPIIGITTNFSHDDEIGIRSKIGAPLQQWQMIADDYVKAVEMAGGIPILIPLYDNEETALEIIRSIDGLILSGGNDIDPQHYGEAFHDVIGEIMPERDEQELSLAREAILKTKMPVLGICRGNQLLNVAFGGTLHQDMANDNLKNHFFATSPKYHAVHKVKLLEGSKCRGIIGKEIMNVNSYHHQSIKSVSDKFRAVAFSDDGIVEAIEIKEDRFAIGLQWHPEMMVDKHEDQIKIFYCFVKACKDHKMEQLAVYSVS